MKNIIFLIPFLLILASCQDKQEGFLLKGSIGGNAEGMKVLLADAYAYPFVILDSTVIQNGKFLLKGRIDSPGLYQLIIDRSGEGQEGTMLASKFYLENSNISYTGHIDSLPTYYWNKERMTREPVITGSKEQDLYIQYQQENQALNQEFSQIYNQYLKVYHLPALEGKFHTHEGIALAKQITKLEEAKRDAQWAFIEKHPQSTVGYDLACEMAKEAKKQGKILNIGVCNRHHKSVEVLEQMYREGKFGNIYHVYCSFRDFRCIPGLGGDFTTKSQSGGGVLIDWGVHFFDLNQRKIAFAFFRGTDLTFDGVTCMKIKAANLRGRDINIVGAGKVGRFRAA